MEIKARTWLSPSPFDGRAAQARYLRACETLARIRKLARSTPALQVNIAADGGRQVNLASASFLSPSPREGLGEGETGASSQDGD
jgi:hypothetical protein